MNKQNYTLISLLFYFGFIWAQEQKESDFRLAFYNVENLFDIYDDSLTNDAQFLPNGDKHWSYFKYDHKLKNIAKVLTAVGGWNNAAVIGLCEIENAFVLEELTTRSPLKKLNYRFIHKESPDKRGIDVAMLYDPKQFSPIYYEFYNVKFPESPNSTTRDILYVKGLTTQSDTLHIFVNHWPSRYGGQMKTEGRRQFVALKIRHLVDSIKSTNMLSNVMIIGDLNDAPTDISVSEKLRSLPPKPPYVDNELYSLLYPLVHTQKGTHNYQGHWAVLDHLIVSGNLLNQSNGIYTSPENAYPFDADFLLEDDTKNGGKKTKRSYIGFKYNAGYSDHLPVILNFNFGSKK